MNLSTVQSYIYVNKSKLDIHVVFLHAINYILI